MRSIVVLLLTLVPLAVHAAQPSKRWVESRVLTLPKVPVASIHYPALQFEYAIVEPLKISSVEPVAINDANCKRGAKRLEITHSAPKIRTVVTDTRSNTVLIDEVVDYSGKSDADPTSECGLSDWRAKRYQHAWLKHRLSGQLEARAREAFAARLADDLVPQYVALETIIFNARGKDYTSRRFNEAADYLRDALDLQQSIGLSPEVITLAKNAVKIFDEINQEPMDSDLKVPLLHHRALASVLLHKYRNAAETSQQAVNAGLDPELSLVAISQRAGSHTRINGDLLNNPVRLAMMMRMGSNVVRHAHIVESQDLALSQRLRLLSHPTGRR